MDVAGAIAGSTRRQPDQGAWLEGRSSRRSGALRSRTSVSSSRRDDVPWKDELTAVPEIVEGAVAVATGPGWGADVDEDVLSAHPWPR